MFIVILRAAEGTEDDKPSEPISPAGRQLVLAVVMDATLMRAALVPAFMRLAGRANWWAPRPLRVLSDRFGISESRVPSTPVVDTG